MSRAFTLKLVALTLLQLLLGLPGADPSMVSFKLARQAAPYVEPVTGWMVGNTLSKLTGNDHTAAASPDEIRAYFTLMGRALKAEHDAGSVSDPARTPPPEADANELRAQVQAEATGVEKAIQGDVARAAAQNGLDRSLGSLTRLFPPVYFRFESLPSLLVVSPRNRIEREATVLLRPGLSSDQVEQIEQKVSVADNLSALVTPIGGLAVYPSMVPENADPRWTFRTVAHEWTHQYLALRPLGWRYALGGESDGRMITVNETVAEIVGNELGDQVYRELYSGANPQQAQPSPQQDAFRAEMRTIRTRVDALLAEGQVGEAESFMDASRERLAQQGFFIRKLNQAYFAFYGSYADDPSSAGGIGQQISQRAHQLRSSTPSLGDFLWKISSASSYQDFQHLPLLP